MGRIGSRWLRPLLSPGSWRPIDVARFRQAASSGVAWRDSPFLPRTGRCCPTFDIRDYASARTLAKGDERRIADARKACLARAGELFDVDGVVHRTTGIPLAGVGTVFLRGVEVTGPVWVMGDLGSTCSMDTLGDEECPGATWFNATAMPDNQGGWDRGEGLLPLSASAGVVEAMTAHAPDRWPDGGPWPMSVDDLVRIDDPAGEPDVQACLAVAARCAMVLSPFMATGLGARRPEDVRGMLLERLRPFARPGGAMEPDASWPVELRALCRDVLAGCTAAGVPRDGMWTYVASLGSFAATHELRMREQDADLAGLRF